MIVPFFKIQDGGSHRVGHQGESLAEEQRYFNRIW